MKSPNKLTWSEFLEELNCCSLQFRIIHNLPKRGDAKPAEYMEAALKGVSKRCRELQDAINIRLAEWQRQKTSLSFEEFLKNKVK